jgi:hypothetical protein
VIPDPDARGYYKLFIINDFRNNQPIQDPDSIAELIEAGYEQIEFVKSKYVVN